MTPRVSHDPADESPEAKARWFQSLTLAERMDVLCAVTDLALALRPELAKESVASHVEQAQGRVRVLRRP